MAKPQTENGFIPIATEIAEALMQVNLSCYQSRVLWAIWRKTYGWEKKMDWISNSQLVEMTGIKKSHISRTKKELIAMNIVTSIGNRIGFNKDYESWKLPKQVTGIKVVTNPGQKLPNEDTKLPNEGNTIDTKQQILYNKGKVTSSGNKCQQCNEIGKHASWHQSLLDSIKTI